VTSSQTAPWWQAAVIYQVYPRSFADSDGDGIGDLPGLIDRLPAIASLGVDGLWLTPFQPSPQVDQGYDVSDYCDVDPTFGTLADFDRLLAHAHALGLRILVDLVPNHCSSQHPLFRQAISAGPGSASRDWFHFADGRGENGELPPNNWRSVFGGLAWDRAAPGSQTDRQWYLHLFSPGQPDWNWRNPAVGDLFEEVLRFWFDRGADGVRIDVAHGLYKAEGLPDTAFSGGVIDGLRSNPQVSDQEPVHTVYRRWRRLADGYEPKRLLVGEVNLEPRRAWRYTRPDELHQAFAFAFVHLGWNAEAWAAVGTELERTRQLSGVPPTWALENHDIVRTVTRFGGGERGRARARAALLAMLGLPGPAYLYQGQELGLPEVDVPEAARVDPAWRRGGLCRDGARVPLPWTVDAAGAHGFSPPGATQAPWLPVPADWGDHAMERQRGDAGSARQLAVSALRLRKDLLRTGVFRADDGAQWRVDEGGCLICRRSGGVTVAVAMGDVPVRLPPGELLICSRPAQEPGWLAPDTAAWLLGG